MNAEFVGYSDINDLLNKIDVAAKTKWEDAGGEYHEFEDFIRSWSDLARRLKDYSIDEWGETYGRLRGSRRKPMPDYTDSER